MTTIETREQAYDLPAGTVLRLATGRVADRTPDGWTITGIYDHGVVPRGLYDTDLPAVVLHDPTQPAPAGVNDRDTIAKAIEDRIKASPWVPDATGCNRPFLGATVHDLADAVLATLAGRTVAQVKAEALREAAETLVEYTDSPTPRWDAMVVGWLNARADELEREDKR